MFKKDFSGRLREGESPARFSEKGLRQMQDTPKLVIVGAGVAGLVAALVGLRHGYKPVVVEMGDQAGGLWTSHDVTLGQDRFTMDAGLRLPVLSGLSDWDNEIFFNPRIDFDWIRWDGWPVESGITQGRFTPESSCADMRGLAPDMLKAGIKAMAEALARSPDTDPHSYADDAEYVTALYGDIFRDQAFAPALQGITGQRLEDAAPSTSRIFVPRRLVVCEPGEIDALVAQYPSLGGYLGHATHATLPEGRARQFVCPADKGIRGWIAALGRHLEDLGAEFRYGARTTAIERNGDGLNVTLDSGEVLPAARMIWTVPPVMLLQLLPDLGVAPLRPELLTLGIQHVRLKDFPAGLRAQYVLNFNADAGFFRAVFWDNIMEAKDHLISFELLFQPGDVPSDEETCRAALADLIRGGALPEGVEHAGQHRMLFPNALPRITPAYKTMNEDLMQALERSCPALSCIGRAAGGSLFLDDIIQEAVKMIDRDV